MPGVVSGTECAVELNPSELMGLIGDLDLDSVVRRALPLAAQGAHARAGALWVLDETGEVAASQTRGMSAGTGHRVHERVAGLPAPGRWTDPELGPVVAAPVGAGDGDPGAGVLLLAGPDGERFTVDDELALAGLARVLDVVVGNARSFSRSERRRLLVEATAHVSEALHPPYPLVEPVNRIVTGAAEVLRSELAAIVRCGEHGHDVAAAVSPPAGGLPDLVAALSSPIREAQETGEVFERPYGDRGTVAGAPLNPELAFEGVLLVAVDRGRGTLTAEDRELLTSFVTHGSLVLDRAVLLRERQDAVVAADRDRIARDLHDLVVQRVFATGLRLQAVRHSTDAHRMRAEVDAAVKDLDTTIRDIRATIFELEHGPDASLRAEVAELVREYQPLLGFLPTVRTWGPVNSFVGRPVANDALAVLREALSNCMRHSAASSCVIELVVEDDWFTLRVTDDGRGLPEGLRESGLRNLRTRAEAHGGGLRLRAATPRGTRLEWQVPVTVED